MAIEYCYLLIDLLTNTSTTSSKIGILQVVNYVLYKIQGCGNNMVNV